MKIVMGADQYPEYINGAATFTARLATGLAAAGHTVDLLWPSAHGGHDTYLDHGVRVHRLSSVLLPGEPGMRVSLSPAANRQVEHLLAIARPDVVHVQSHLPLGRSLLRRARSTGTPVLATNHFMPENLLHHVPVARRFPTAASRWAWRDLERVYAAADLITVPSPRAAELLAAATDLPPAEVVSCGIDLDRFTFRPARTRPSRPTVLFVGRLEREKHVDELLEAFARPAATGGAQLEVVGMGSLRGSLEARAHALGLAGRIRFLGAVDDDALRAAYGRADVFVMPGTAELQSIATLEAMAGGLPVVGADAMALPHLVRPGVNGIRYVPGDVDGLADAIVQVLGDDDRRAQLAQGSRAIAEAHAMRWTIEAYERLYASLHDASGRRSGLLDLAMAS